MKKFYLLTALMCLFVLQGCPKPAPVEEDAVLTPIQTTYQIGAEGGSVSISFKTNLEYKVSSDASWLTVPASTKAVETKTVTVTAAENTSTEQRSGNITIKGGDLTATITVNQAGITPSIVINGATTFTAPAAGYQFSVDVTSNVDYEVSVNAGWIKADGGNSFIVEANESEEERSATIDFYWGDLKKSVAVKQNGKEKEEEPYIEVGTTTYNVAAAGGPLTIAVTSNVDYQTSISESWVSGTGANLTIEANETFEARTATVTYSYGDISKKVTIKQAGQEKEVDILENGGSSAYTVPAAGETIEIIVRSNVEYKVDVSEDWISQVVTRAVREDHLNFTVKANESEEARSATISVSYNELAFAVKVNQKAYSPEPEEPYLEISPNEATVSAEGETVTINVNANYDYEVTCSASWAEVTKNGGTVTVVVAANPSTTDSRKALIRFAIEEEGLEEYFTLIQKPAASDEDPFDVGSDLSVNGTANCYVVTKAGTYTFDASVMGNGEEGILWDENWIATGLLYPESIAKVNFNDDAYKGEYKCPDHIEVLWQDAGDGDEDINDGDIFEGKPAFSKTRKVVTFTTNGNNGSAVLTLCTKGGTVLWSWHIWCTDSPKLTKMVSANDDEIFILDRNLGATSANPADGGKTYGYYYQWGRKDPLRAYVGMARDFKEAEVEMKPSVQNPAVVYSNGSKTNEWYNTGSGLGRVTQLLWGNPKWNLATIEGLGPKGIHPGDAELGELKKTIYDPCPPGYMVACEKAWTGVDEESIELLDNGVLIPDDNGEDSFYPFAGFITALNSSEREDKLGWFAYAGFDPSAMGSTHEERHAAFVYTSQTGYFPGGTIGWDAYGASYFSVRILKWDDPNDLTFDGITSHIRQRGMPVRCMKIPAAE